MTAIAAPALNQGTDQGGSYARSLAAPRPGVWLRGVIYGGSGYAHENLQIAIGLAAHGIAVRIDPMQFQHDRQNILSPETQTALEYMKLQPLDLAQSIILHAMPAHAVSLEYYAKRRILRTMFETDRVPEGWVERCNAMDEVWVPSKFNHDTFLAAGVEERRLRIVPEGQNTQMFRPGLLPLKIERTRGFNFLSVFEWTQRKAPDVLLKAFCAEFKADEDVALILRTYAHPDPAADLLPKVVYFIERELGIKLEDTAPIILLPGFLPHAEVPRLYASADCFVLPSRGEGWGLPYTEALATGVPVIGTRWSGQLDFLTDSNSYLIDCQVRPTAPNVDIDIFAGHRWAEPSVEHLRTLLRHVFTHREEAKGKAMAGRRDMVEKQDVEIIAQRWRNEVQRLLAE